MRKCVYFWTQHWQKYGLHRKMLQIKVIQNWISRKKFHERICLSLPWVELGGSKDQYVWNLIMYRNGILDSLWSSTLSKISTLWKKNLSCLESNFVQKSPQARRVEPGASIGQYVWNLIMYRNGILDSLWGSTLPKIRFSSTHGGDGDMSSQTFLCEIQFRTTFIWIFFRCNAYFWQRWAPKWTYFLVIIHLTFKIWWLYQLCDVTTGIRVAASKVCILTFSNSGHSHRMCIDVSFSTRHLLHEGVFALLFAALPTFCNIFCPVYLWSEHTYQLIPPNTVSWSHTFHGLSILSVSFFQ